MAFNTPNNKKPKTGGLVNPSSPGATRPTRRASRAGNLNTAIFNPVGRNLPEPPSLTDQMTPADWTPEIDPASGFWTGDYVAADRQMYPDARSTGMPEGYMDYITGGTNSNPLLNAENLGMSVQGLKDHLNWQGTDEELIQQITDSGLGGDEVQLSSSRLFGDAIKYDGNNKIVKSMTSELETK